MKFNDQLFIKESDRPSICNPRLHGGSKLRYRYIGRTGLKISEISLGAWLTFGGSLDQEKSFTNITKALDQGVNFIDIADVYARGQAESVVGNYLSEGSVNRKNLVLSSKVFWPMSDDINDR